MRGHGPFPYQVDGDYLGETEHLEFRHEPDALEVRAVLTRRDHISGTDRVAEVAARPEFGGEGQLTARPPATDCRSVG